VRPSAFARPLQIDTDLINAGAYVLERSVLDGMAPAGTNILR